MQAARRAVLGPLGQSADDRAGRDRRTDRIAVRHRYVGGAQRWRAGTGVQHCHHRTSGDLAGEGDDPRGGGPDGLAGCRGQVDAAVPGGPGRGRRREPAQHTGWPADRPGPLGPGRYTGDERRGPRGDGRGQGAGQRAQHRAESRVQHRVPRAGETESGPSRGVEHRSPEHGSHVREVPPRRPPSPPSSRYLWTTRALCRILVTHTAVPGLRSPDNRPALPAPPAPSAQSRRSRGASRTLHNATRSLGSTSHAPPPAIKCAARSPQARSAAPPGASAARSPEPVVALPPRPGRLGTSGRQA
ncbi:hypothetical protein FHR34_002326 [Kitasatospora kifunensis]|uniref:Uncharacterized protein n=1 Tax=Kitasatospora kifunensis TaxID=58351 RepID=A0A7W7R177_KITKI|nr:hypothetical protein [Kitasatospora kifunensis]